MTYLIIFLCVFYAFSLISAISSLREENERLRATNEFIMDNTVEAPVVLNSLPVALQTIYGIAHFNMRLNVDGVEIEYATSAPSPRVIIQVDGPTVIAAVKKAAEAIPRLENSDVITFQIFAQ